MQEDNLTARYLEDLTLVVSELVTLVESLGLRVQLLEEKHEQSNLSGTNKA